MMKSLTDVLAPTILLQLIFINDKLKDILDKL